MSKVFVTSDVHFGHDNIIRYCSRPFRDSETMDTYLIDKWNSCVGLNDTVFFLGDFAMGPLATDGFIAGKLQNLNGKKKMVLGNHDQPMPKFGQSGLKEIIEIYQPKDVEILANIHEETIDGVNFVMCHYPINDWNGKSKGVVHLHGHKHNGFSMSKAREMKGQGRYDIGVDMYGGPVEITGDLRFLNSPAGWGLKK